MEYVSGGSLPISEYELHHITTEVSRMPREDAARTPQNARDIQIKALKCVARWRHLCRYKIITEENQF